MLVSVKIESMFKDVCFSRKWNIAMSEKDYPAFRDDLRDMFDGPVFGRLFMLTVGYAAPHDRVTATSMQALLDGIDKFVDTVFDYKENYERANALFKDAYRKIDAIAAVFGLEREEAIDKMADAFLTNADKEKDDSENVKLDEDFRVAIKTIKNMTGKDEKEIFAKALTIGLYSLTTDLLEQIGIEDTDELIKDEILRQSKVG